MIERPLKKIRIFFGFLEKGDCVGCLASLTQTILGCASSETGIGIAICVAGIVGVGNTCYPCICWAIGISLVVIMKLFNFSAFFTFVVLKLIFT